MRLLAVGVAFALSGCSLIRTSIPPPAATWTARSDCSDGIVPPLVDGLLAAGGAFIAVGGTGELVDRTDSTGASTVAVGAVTLAAGVATAALFVTSMVIGIKRTGACRDELAAWDAQDLERQRAEDARRQAAEAAQAAEDARRLAEGVAERAAAAKREDQVRAALDTLKGFQKVEWGATPAEVEALFPGGAAAADKAKSIWIVQREVAGLNANLSFIFDGSKRLTNVTVAFEDAQRGFANWQQACEAVTGALQQRYGLGSRGGTVLDSYSIQWAGAVTLIQLDCSAFAAGSKKSVMLFYADRKFEEAHPTVKGDDL